MNTEQERIITKLITNVLDACGEANRRGLCNGWVSSEALMGLVSRMMLTIGQKETVKMLKDALEFIESGNFEAKAKEMASKIKRPN